MRIISWNINSVRLRMDMLKKIVKRFKPDILCLQETKCPNDLFPHQDFYDMGFRYSFAYGIKGYNGVSIASKINSSKNNKKKFCNKDDGRHISVNLSYRNKVITVHNFYVPAGGDIPDPNINEKFKHKLDFLDEATNWFSKKSGKDKSLIALVGDINIAPDIMDVWSHKQLTNIVSHTKIERIKMELFKRSFNFEDAIRNIHGYEKKIYSWWSYRARDWKKSNRGRRLDHIWTSKKLNEYLVNATIIKNARGWKRPSDHVPMVADFKIK